MLPVRKIEFQKAAFDALLLGISLSLLLRWPEFEDGDFTPGWLIGRVMADATLFIPVILLLDIVPILFFKQMARIIDRPGILLESAVGTVFFSGLIASIVFVGGLQGGPASAAYRHGAQNEAGFLFILLLLPIFALQYIVRFFCTVKAKNASCDAG